MPKTRRTVLRLATTALAAAAWPRRAPADAWPSRPLRAVIPFTAGSTIDIIGRIVLEPLAAQLRQPIVVENRGGAGGSIGAAAVAKADPDGYTLLINASAHSAAPAIYPNLSYDTARDFSTVNGVKAKGGSMNGPGSTIVNGTLFVSSGYGSLGYMPGNVLLAFTVDGK